MTRNPFTTAYMIFCPGTTPLASELGSDDTIARIIQCWSRTTLDPWPKLAKAVLCKCATHAELFSADTRPQVLAWACQEAAYWWPALGGKPATREQLIKLYEELSSRH